MTDRMTIWVGNPRLEKDGDLYSAYCDELEIASSGVTEKDATKNLISAIISYCKSLDEIGVLEDRLTEKGINVEILTEPPVGDQKRYPILVG